MLSHFGPIAIAKRFTTATARLSWLAVSITVLSSSYTSAQFGTPNKPEAPLPPPIITKSPLSKGETKALIEKSMDEFQNRVMEAYEKDPRRAEQMIRDFSRVSQSIGRAGGLGSPGTQRESGYGGKSPRFDVARGEIQRLTRLGGDQEAKQLNTQLGSLAAAIETGEITLPEHVTPEVHYVRLTSGTTLPVKLRTKNNRFSKSYAEIHVQRTGCPVILILESHVPMLWNVNADDEVDVFAVIVESLETQEVMGLENPLLLDTQSAIEKRLFDSQSTNRWSLGEMLAGAKAVTRFVASSYVKPIVIGPKNPTWMARFVDHETELLISECRHRTRVLSAKTLPDFEYSASFITGANASSPQYCRGRSTVVGPLVESLIPHPGRSIRQVSEVPDGEDVLKFGLNTSGTLVTIETNKSAAVKMVPVPLDNKILGVNSRMRAMTYDTKRHRLLCAPQANEGPLVALDIDSGDWSIIGHFDVPLIGLAYFSQADEVWAIAQSYRAGLASDVAARLIRMSADGKEKSQVTISHPLLDISGAGSVSSTIANFVNQSMEMVIAGEYAVLTGTRPTGNGNVNQRENYHFVIAPESGELVYDGPLQVHASREVPQEVKEKPNYSLLGHVSNKFHELKATAAAEELTPQEKLDLDQQFDSIQEFLRGKEAKFEVGKDVAPHVYLVGFLAGNRQMKLRVTDTSPVVLILSASQKIDWMVEVADGVKLEQIIADGYSKPTVVCSQKNVPIKVHSGKEALRLLSDSRHLDTTRLSEYVAQRTGLTLSASSISSRYRSPLEVGPQDGALRLHLADHRLDNLLLKLGGDQSGISQVLEEQSFFALHRGTLPGSNGNNVARNQSQVFWNEFAIRGPKIGRSTTAYRSAAFACFNADASSLFCADLHRLYIYDMATGNNETISLRTAAKNIGRVTGVHFDEKYRRLLVDTQTGLWGFDPNTKKLTLLITKQTQRSSTTVFSPANRCWYALEQERRQSREVTRIRRYNEHYAYVDEVELSKPMSRGSRSFNSSYPPQLIILKGFLAIIDDAPTRTYRTINGRRVARSNYISHITICDSRTGQVVHRGKLEPQIEFQNLSEAELQSLWAKLRGASELEAETLMWQLASGGDTALAFLKTQYSKAEVVGDIDVELLVKDLDDHRYSVRDSAYRKLLDAGNRFEDRLKASIADEKNVAPEVRERVEALIQQWGFGQPKNAEELQKARGIEVLYRIGGEASRNLLDVLSGEQFESYIRIQASRSLRGESLLLEGFQNPAMELQNGLFVPR